MATYGQERQWREEQLDWLHEQHEALTEQSALLREQNDLLRRIARHTTLFYVLTIVGLVVGVAWVLLVLVQLVAATS